MFRGVHIGKKYYEIELEKTEELKRKGLRKEMKKSWKDF
jgi:hypothetical protein